MKLLLSLLVTQVVWVTLGYADDVTPTPVTSLVMQSQGGVVVHEDVFESSEAPSTTTQAPPQPSKPKMYKMHVTSHIEYRFANTLISSRVGNPANVSQEVYFSVTLPETAFISKFLMEVDGKVYEATVKEKEEAKKVYDHAVATGQGAAHVAVSARDSNVFTVSVNVEPTKKVNFNLTYEELLTRRLGAYNHVINLDPGQIVSDLRVDVYIKENQNITVLRVPELRSGNEVDADESTSANPLAKVERQSAKEAHISFAPTEAEQKTLGRVKGLDEPAKPYYGYGPPPTPKVVEGLGGQFVVQYDVDRSDKSGEVLVNNGYFVHFFAPQELTPLPKHALFVLDVSGSMEGRKIEQLKEAMNAILDDLNEGDYFNIIEFSYSVTVWNLDETISSAVFSPYNSYVYDDAPKANIAPTPAFPATKEYIAKAKEIVAKMRAGGGTNIYDTLKTVIRVAHEGLENVTSTSEEKRNPIIVFLTDGEPTVGETRLNKIFSVVEELNANPEAALFSLAFGDDADLDFLKKLSLKNSGFARKIYEASDAALQLRDFYRQISSPLLANVTFNYQPDKIELTSTTRTRFHTLFSGSEIIVAGRIKPSSDDKVTDLAIEGQISGLSYTGDSTYDISRPYPVFRDEIHPVTSLERLWAYLTIQQLLEKQDAKGVEEVLEEPVKVDNSSSAAANETKTKIPLSPKKEALKLALQYSFVTPLTSLVVVKPNATKETSAVKPAGSDQYYGYGGVPVDRIGSSGYPLALGVPISSPAQNFAGQPYPISAGMGGGGFGGAGGGSGFVGSSNTHLLSGGQTLSLGPQEDSDFDSDFESAPAGGSGSPGASGPYPGQAGSFGRPGLAGTSWSPGQAGTPGSPGLAGTPGRPGLAGTPGSPGQAGTPGSPGQAGYPGLAGTSGQAGYPVQANHVGTPGSYPSPYRPPAPRPPPIQTPLQERPTFSPPPPRTTTRPAPTPRSTTTTTTAHQEPVLISLDELEWLEEVTNSTDLITLPFDNLEGNKTYHLERNNQTTADVKDCTTLSGKEGQCRHLSECSLSAFKHHMQDYKEYFCEINNFAGACCPKSLFPQDTTPETPSLDTSTATSTTSE